MMGFPPSANFEGHSVADAIVGLSSDATTLGALSTISLVVLFTVLLTIIHNLGPLLDIDFQALANFGFAFYRITTNWAICLRQYIFTTQNVRNGPRFTIDLLTRIYTSSLTRIHATSRFLSDASTILPWLTRVLNVVPDPSTVTVSTLRLDGRGTVAVIHSLPSDVSAPEVRRFLETILWTQYRHEIRAERSGVISPDNAPNTPKDDEMTIVTEGRGLWQGTCVTPGLIPLPDSPAAMPTSTPSPTHTSSSSGINTPTSGSGSSASASASETGSTANVDLVGEVFTATDLDPAGSGTIVAAALALIPPKQRRSTSWRA